MLWSNFDSLCNSGENVDPNIIWEKDPESLETLEYCTGANPVMNLINCSASAGQTTPAQAVLPTPVRQQTVSKVAGGDKVTLATPQPPTPLANVTACDSPQVETPLLYYNSISSTPLHLASMASPAQMSGISALNITADSDISQTQLKLPSFMPPPLRFVFANSTVSSM